MPPSPSFNPTSEPAGEPLDARIILLLIEAASSPAYSGRNMSFVDEVVQRCLTLPGSVEDHPFGERPTVYKVGGKMFVLLSEEDDPPRVSIKLPPEEGLALRAEFPDQVLPGYHLNKRHWNTVVLDGVLESGEVLDLIRQSYDAVVAGLPRRLRPAPVSETPAVGPDEDRPAAVSAGDGDVRW
jgi:predicted DNA-binding protein (MmcQ/YjbR family)